MAACLGRKGRGPQGPGGKGGLPGRPASQRCPTESSCQVWIDREAQVWGLVGQGSEGGCPRRAALHPALSIRARSWCILVPVLESDAGPSRVLWVLSSLFPPHPSRGRLGLASPDHPEGRSGAPWGERSACSLLMPTC